MISLVTGIRHAAEQSLEEVNSKLLIGVAIRRAEFVEDPHELLDMSAVLLGVGTCGFEILPVTTSQIMK